jgi:hypothetical protein
MNKFYLIFNVSETALVDFNEVFETSAETLRYSLDQTKTLIKYDSYHIPSFYENMVTKEGPYTHEEIVSIMATSEWTDLNFDPLIKY